MRRVNLYLYSDSISTSFGEVPPNLAFAAFGKDYKMKIFKPEPILHPDVRIETIDKDHTRRWDKAVPDCFSVGTLGENWTSNEGHVSLTHCDGLVHTWVILYHSMI